jgi:hypothetical protein
MRIMRNKLIQYKGGGYDGCFWEWNFCLFDGRGKFHNLKSTGRNGIKTALEAKELIKDKRKIYIYDLKSKKSLKEFRDETNNHLVDVIGTKINQLYKKEIVSFECDDCKNLIFLNSTNSDYPAMFHDDNEYHWEHKYCENCYLSHSCGYCGAFNDVEENNADDKGHCIHCQPIQKEVFNE